MKKNKFLNIVTRNFHIYKASCTMFLLGLSAILAILSNIFGMFYLVLSFLPVIAWVILFNNERKNTYL
ncbi:hypothetical protein [Clostridium tagluense]|uniref:hypothetical protein n=1 Tax=Clostridium tagluense TaxID=360422 RepID=UPI001C6E65F1|nr:hypothetical protein [Clostridium tagluense]MBW9158848.1 hypothetical protein [Clostridium tagluense]WLC65798.1 hypothetical protein KTC93_00535 [Clostridium tagluense]